MLHTLVTSRTGRSVCVRRRGWSFGEKAGPTPTPYLEERSFSDSLVLTAYAVASVNKSWIVIVRCYFGKLSVFWPWSSERIRRHTDTSYTPPPTGCREETASPRDDTTSQVQWLERVRGSDSVVSLNTNTQQNAPTSITSTNKQQHTAQLQCPHIYCSHSCSSSDQSATHNHVRYAHDKVTWCHMSKSLMLHGNSIPGINWTHVCECVSTSTYIYITTTCTHICTHT